MRIDWLARRLADAIGWLWIFGTVLIAALAESDRSLGLTLAAWSGTLWVVYLGLGWYERTSAERMRLRMLRWRIRRIREGRD